MAYLTLEDGTIFKGEAFGAKVDIMGEVVFLSLIHIYAVFVRKLRGF